MIEVPPSTEYLILDARGTVLAKDRCPALAMRRGRTEIETAVAVVGFPSGVLLAHIVRGVTDARPGLRAQAAWKKAENERVIEADRLRHENVVEAALAVRAEEVVPEANWISPLEMGLIASEAQALDLDLPPTGRRPDVVPEGLAPCACETVVEASGNPRVAPRADGPGDLESLARAAARRDRKNVRRRERRRLAREARKAAAGHGSVAPDSGRESGVRAVGAALEESAAPLVTEVKVDEGISA